MMAGADGRKRGAQPGNKNALKHGFYARQFELGEIEDLDAALTTGLQDEITMLRVITRRVMALANGVEDLEEAINLLGAMGLAASRLAGLLKTQKILSGESGADVAQAISEALADVVRELQLK